MTTFLPEVSIGFRLNTRAYPGGRSDGSLTLGDLCAIRLMQFFPFFNTAAIAMLRDFEQAVYA